MSSSASGKFIVIEGPEGCGKSTNLAYIQSLLQQAGISFIATREPGGTKFGETLRNLLLDPATGDLAGETELLLMFAARLEHVSQLVKPALQNGQWVLCDRFVDSSYAYQGGGRGLLLEKIDIISRWCLHEFKPDLTLLLDVPVEISKQRIRDRGAADRFEKLDDDFYERVRAVFLTLAQRDQQRYQVIDASQSLPQVQSAIQVSLQQIIAQWQSR